jgi:hypothetical protein
MSGRHSELSPSSSVRWLNCPGSVRLSRGKPDDASAAAEEGTDAHELGALCLTLDADAHTFIGKTLPNGYEVDAEMAECVQQYLDYVRPLPGEHLIEEWLDTSRMTGEEGGGGTGDHVAVAPTEIAVTDYKHGRTPVEIVGNTQTRIYASAALLRSVPPGVTFTAPERVVMAIVQPRVFGEPQVEVISGDELVAWIKDVLRPGAAATRDPDAPLVPGDKQCQWCRAKGDCPALAEYAAATAGAADLVEFNGGFTPPAPSGLSGDAIADIMGKTKLVRAWLDAVESEAATRLFNSREVGDWKLVRGKKGNRSWQGDEDAITAVLRNNYGLANETIFKLSLLSPTAILALPEVKASPDLLAAFITQKEGGLTPAPGTDKRAAAFPGELLAAEFTTID